MSSDIGDTVVDEPTPQDVLDVLEQDSCQIEGDQPIVARADAEDDLLEPAPVEVVQKESDTESVHTREGDSNGEVEHQERNDTVEEPDDVFFVPHARASTAGFTSLDEVDLAEVCAPKFMRGAYRGAMKLSLPRDPKGINSEQQHSGNAGMEVILSPAQVVALQTTPRWFGPSREVAGAHVQICGW